MYKLFIAARYLRRNWLNLVGVLAVAIAVMVPICVLSVMKGFEEEIRAHSRATLSDLIIEPWSNNSFSGYEAMLEKIERLPHVKSAAPEFAGLAIVQIKTPVETLTRYAQFRGIDIERELLTTDLAKDYRNWRATRATEEIGSILAGGASAQEVLTARRLRDILCRLREEDFDKLPSPQKEFLRTAAERQDVEIEACFREAEAAVPTWPDLTEEHYAPAFIGSEMAVVYRNPDGSYERLPVGAEIVLVIPTEIHDSTRAFQKCRVAGLIKSGLSEYDVHTVIVPLDVIQERLHKEGQITKINIRLDDFAYAESTRAQLLGILTVKEIQAWYAAMRPILERERPELIETIDARIDVITTHVRQGSSDTLSGATARQVTQDLTLISKGMLARADALNLTMEQTESLRRFMEDASERIESGLSGQFMVSTWEDKRQSFLRAIGVERRLMAFILFFVTIVAGFLIFSILYTTVHVKTKDIGVLKSIGGTVRGIMGLYLLNGTLIGIIGAVIGAILGLLITFRLNEIEQMLSDWIGFRLFPRDIYYLDQLPVAKEPVPSALFIAAMAVVVCLLASAIPAWKASRMDAVEALRYE